MNYRLVIIILIISLNAFASKHNHNNDYEVRYVNVNMQLDSEYQNFYNPLEVLPTIKKVFLQLKI